MSGLSPKQNREIPPLRYEVVYQLKIDFPQLEFILNGGVTSLAQAETHLQHVDGVMVGREAYQNPYVLADVDRRIFCADTVPVSRYEAVEQLLPYIGLQLGEGLRLNTVARHTLGLFHGEPGARGWRRHLSENVGRPGADINVVREALRFTNQ